MRNWTAAGGSQGSATLEAPSAVLREQERAENKVLGPLLFAQHGRRGLKRSGPLRSPSRSPIAHSSMVVRRWSLVRVTWQQLRTPVLSPMYKSATALPRFVSFEKH